MHRLLIPARMNEVRGKFVDQFGMRWCRTALAEVVGRRDDPASEIFAPNAVHMDPRDERRRTSLRSQQPVREPEPAAGGGRVVWHGVRAIFMPGISQYRERSRLNVGFTQVIQAARQ